MSDIDVAELDGVAGPSSRCADMLVTSPDPASQAVQIPVGVLTSVELFAGCGGLALGLAQAGFMHAKVVELDDQAYATLENNRHRKLPLIADWPIIMGDVADVDYSDLAGKIDLVAGGPPCQPFSIGGKHLGPSDPRNMWPEAIRAVRELRPKAFLFENVRGLLRPSWATYLEYLELALSWPSIAPSAGEKWEDHLGRLRLLTSGKHAAKREYRVSIRPINAADYGAPQKRHRAIVMGVRCDISDEWVFPAPTHSREALLWTQHIETTYWKRHGIDAPASGPTGTAVAVVERLNRGAKAPAQLPWVTVRDALEGLPEPTTDAEPITHHRLRLGARAYEKHTGSALDEPAKALKAGDHGVPGGENMLALPDGSVRYFTLREMARLQGFPDQFNFGEGWKRPIKQIGNAVPVQVGACFGVHLKSLLTL